MARNDSGQPEGNELPHGWWLQPPSTLEACIVQLQALMQRVAVLESEIAMLKSTQSLGQLRKVEYRIGRLYVKDLSGTLSIGIASFGNETELSDLSDLPIHWNGQEMSELDDDESWNPDEPEELQP